MADSDVSVYRQDIQRTEKTRLQIQKVSDQCYLGMCIDIAAGQKDAEGSKKYGGDEHDRRQNERELSLRLFNMIKPNETFFSSITSLRYQWYPYRKRSTPSYNRLTVCRGFSPSAFYDTINAEHHHLNNQLQLQLLTVTHRPASFD